MATRIVQLLMDDPDVRFFSSSAPRPQKPQEKPKAQTKKKLQAEKAPRPAPPPKPIKPIRPTPAQLQEEARARRRECARELFLAGRSLGSIAEELGVTAPTVAADVADLRVRQRRLCDPVALRARQEEHVRLYREGWSLRQIADKRGLNVGTVRWDLAACGIDLSASASKVGREAASA